MESIKSNIGNIKQPLYDGIQADNIYYSDFDDDPDINDMVLPYGQEINDQKIEEVSESYAEAMDEYIGIHVVVPIKYSIPVLEKVEGRERYHPGKLVGHPKKKSILDTIIYELEFPDYHVEYYLVNTILENLLEQVDSDGWDTGLLYKIVSFCYDPNVIIQKEYDEFTRVDTIENTVITTKGWDFQG